MSSSIIVLGCPVRPIPASLIPAGSPVFLANCYTQNRVIQRSFCAAAIQSLACLLRVRSVELVPLATFPLYPHELTWERRLLNRRECQKRQLKGIECLT